MDRENLLKRLQGGSSGCRLRQETYRWVLILSKSNHVQNVQMLRWGHTSIQVMIRRARLVALSFVPDKPPGDRTLA